VAVIDFRAKPYSEEFCALFDAALRAALRKSAISFTLLCRHRDAAGYEPVARWMKERKPDVYYATTTDVARIVRELNPLPAPFPVPIIFSGAVDPIEAEIVTSLARPDNYMTGFVTYAAVDRKRIELIADLSPRIRRIGLVVPQNSLSSKEVEECVAAGRRKGVEVIPLVFPSNAPAGTVAALARRHRVDVLDIPSSAYLRNHESELLEIGRSGEIALTFRSWYYVKLGGLLAYEPLEFDYPVKAAALVARVLEGVPTADIPVELPSEFVLSINRTAATRLPYPLNKDILKRANRVYP